MAAVIWPGAGGQKPHGRRHRLVPPQGQGVIETIGRPQAFFERDSDRVS
jgi:hypothetical protein